MGFMSICWEKALVVRAQVYLRSSLPCSFVLLCTIVHLAIYMYWDTHNGLSSKSSGHVKNSAEPQLLFTFYPSNSVKVKALGRVCLGWRPWSKLLWIRWSLHVVFTLLNLLHLSANTGTLLLAMHRRGERLREWRTGVASCLISRFVLNN